MLKASVLSVIYLLLLLPGISVAAQGERETDNLAAYCKFWGFLKYYHPKISKEGLDWDLQLTGDYERVKAAKNKAELNAVFLEISLKLGALAPVKEPKVFPDSLSRNADFSWLSDTSVFSPAVIAYLLEVKRDHVPFRNKYVNSAFATGNAVLRENAYPEMLYPGEKYRFLALSRYWNVIRYFFPYAYLMDRPWERTLITAIPKFMSAADGPAYYNALYWLTSQINDQHASYVFNKSHKSMPIYHEFPFAAWYDGQQLIVAYKLNDSLCDRLDIRYGDIITAIDQRPTQEIWDSIERNNPFSNKIQSCYRYGFKLLQTNKDSIHLQIMRGDVLLKRTVKNYTAGSFPIDKKAVLHFSLKPFEIRTDSVSKKKYGYINMGSLKRKNINRVMRKMKKTDYLVIDSRNYPNWTIFSLSKRLVPGKQSFARFTFPDLDHPGYYKSQEPVKTLRSQKRHYKGKVVILEDQNTMSQAEYTVMALSKTPGAMIIGEQTAGADGNVSVVPMPGDYYLGFSGLGVYYPNGNETQRIGIIPDIRIHYTAKDKIENTDPILKAALEYIRTH